jgi:hypothetical protein
MKIADADIQVTGRFFRIARLEQDGLDFPECPEVLIEKARKSSLAVDLLTFVQTLPDTQPCFAYHMEWDNVAALRVSSFEHWWTKQIDFRVRNKARKSEKSGLAIREATVDDALIRGISSIYNESPVRQGKAFWHYGKDLDTVRRENSTFPDRSIVIGAFDREVLVGFAKLVIDRTQKQASVIQILSSLRHRDKAPTNGLIAHAVRCCADRNIPYLVYSNFAYGGKEDTLTDFKRHNGFQRVDVPRYYIPLTVVGRMALRLGFHHSFKERVPESLLIHFRKARRAWYTRRSNIPRGAM